ncbi:MAG: hypothetical protein QMC07_03940 [Flavobacteriaceae bacterium]|jgi:hypothetical protein|tara:strand:- start:253 stop:447 length:195 start_codon:yes stop_codon:yes gene_type:complete
MKNRLLRVTIVTLIVYGLYTFFFIEDVADSSVNQKIISVESNDMINEKDSLMHVNDTLVKTSKE